MNTQKITSTRHFHFRRLRPGAYAALARPEGLAASNCGIVDLGSRVVVIDTSYSPQAARDLRSAAVELTGREIDLVLLTHHHSDHTWGNQVFGEKTTIFSSAETYRVMAQSGAESLARSLESSNQALREGQVSLQKMGDGRQQEELQRTISTARERLADASSIRLRLPDMTSEGQANFHGTRARLEFIPFPKAHCPGNSVIYLPDDGVLYTGDILFAHMHPYIGDGDPQAWLEALDRIEALQPEIVVPGHGGVSSQEEVRELAEYLRILTQAVQAFVQAGKPAEALGEIRLPEPFVHWEPKTILARSLKFLYDRYRESARG